MSLFFFNDPASTDIYTLSLHDALPIFLHHPALYTIIRVWRCVSCSPRTTTWCERGRPRCSHQVVVRSEEHTSELQSQSNLVCRLLLEKKKTKKTAQRPEATSRLTHCSA